MEFITKSTEETINLGIIIGKLLNPGYIICLNGDLGTGKTHITKGIAKGLLIDEHITSPTFNIVNEYDGRLKFYHFDVYRVNDADEIYAIGFDEYIFSSGVSVIEWSTYIKELIPKDYIDIKIEKQLDIDENHRKITINGIGSTYKEFNTALKNNFKI